MNKIVALILVFFWFSNQILAIQTSSVTKGNEEGNARYYAANLNGKLTSFGEKYDDALLTASHSKYPLNTLIKVTNLENNLTVQVRINDYCKCEEEGKIINLSREAASKLGMMASGKARVKLEVIQQPTAEKLIDKSLNDLLNKGREITSKEENKPIKSSVTSSTKTPEEPFSANRTYNIWGLEKNPKGFGVQVTALSNLNMVQDLYDELVKMGIKKEEIYVQVGMKETGKIFRLIFGEFYTKEDANEKLAWLSKQGYKGMIRLHYNL